MTQSIEENVRQLVKEVSQRLLDQNLRLATAESCTGGWLSQLLTSVPGSSGWFEAGFVTYSNDAKQRMLGVAASLFDAEGPGAVSEEVVTAMARGALERCGADVAVATSGIAGPDGGSEAKPVGTVWLAWVERGGRTTTRLYHYHGDRYSIRLATVEQGLKGVIGLLDTTALSH